MSTHTPGPWWVDEDSAEVYGQPDKGKTAARCIVQFSERFTKRERADAALIAASPDLLAALEALTSEAAAMFSPDEAHWADVEAARAAIAKARGEK